MIKFKTPAPYTDKKMNAKLGSYKNQKYVPIDTTSLIGNMHS
jgi:hypothetical protein